MFTQSGGESLYECDRYKAVIVFSFVLEKHFAKPYLFSYVYFDV